MTVLAYPTIDPLKETPKPSEIEAAIRLLVAVGDAKNTKATLEKLAAATEAHKAAAAEAEERLARVDHREQGLQKRLDAEADDMARARAEHERRLVQSQADHDQRLAQRERDLVLREAAVKAADAKYLELNSTLERKLALIRKVSDAT